MEVRGVGIGLLSLSIHWFSDCCANEKGGRGALRKGRALYLLCMYTLLSFFCIFFLQFLCLDFYESVTFLQLVRFVPSPT